MKLLNYQAPSHENWFGRLDSTAFERFYQVVKLIDLKSSSKLEPLEKPTFALIGFSCDAGISRNGGRRGAHYGPQEFRKIFGNLAIPARANKFNFYDVGDILCPDDHVELAQESLSEITCWALNNKFLPIIIGGGHEVSFGGYRGAISSLNKNIGIINFDAHFDLRPLSPLGAHSGNSFSHIAHWCKINNRSFDYLVMGIQPAANTLALYEKARELQIGFVEAEYFFSHPKNTGRILEKFLSTHNHIYLSLCMDVFSQALAPGVSAPQSLGLWPHHVLALINQIIDSGKLACFDIAEYSPPLDFHNKTGRLCASVVHAALSRTL
jgi:formiminoglutamase